MRNSIKELYATA